MKTTLVISVVAALCMPAPTIQATSESTELLTYVTEVFDGDANTTVMMMGAGVIKSKSGNNCTIQSEDGNTYQTEPTHSYSVGTYVYHSDPENGWVEILGRAN